LFTAKPGDFKFFHNGKYKKSLNSEVILEQLQMTDILLVEMHLFFFPCKKGGKGHDKSISFGLKETFPGKQKACLFNA